MGVNDKIIKIKETDYGMTISVLSSYAQERGCPAEEKEEFWRQIDSLIRAVPENERIVLGGDLNGHIGQDNANIQRVHGGSGAGERNEGEQITDFAMAFDLTSVNTLKKRKAQMFTYRSGNRERQIDLFL